MLFNYLNKYFKVVILEVEMTFQQYIDNPMGKKNAVFSQRDLYKAMYVEKFDKLLLREAGKIDYTLYIDKKRDRYAIHIKIPSETVKDFYYDAVILFYTNDAAVNASPNLQGYNVKFFSNDPAFVFTYLRVFLKHDLFLEDLKSRASKLALTRDPKEKNPYEVPGYSKILYFAYIYMKAKNLFSKHMYQSYGIPYDPKFLVQNVEHTDKKIADRQRLGEEQAKANAKEAKSNRVENSKSRNLSSLSGNVVGTKKIGDIQRNVTTTKKVGSVRTTKRTPFSSSSSKKK